MNIQIGIVRRSGLWWQALAVGIMLVSVSGAPVAPAKSDLEPDVKGLKSDHSRIATTITFVNKSGEPVRIYWLDFNGDRVLYGKLGSEDALTLATFLTHPWLITDDSGSVWYIYHPAAFPRTVQIVAPWRLAGR